jgi:hypothetical protein
MNVPLRSKRAYHDHSAGESHETGESAEKGTHPFINHQLFGLGTSYRPTNYVNKFCSCYGYPTG